MRLHEARSDESPAPEIILTNSFNTPANFLPRLAKDFAYVEQTTCIAPSNRTQGRSNLVITIVASLMSQPQEEVMVPENLVLDEGEIRKTFDELLGLVDTSYRVVLPANDAS